MTKKKVVDEEARIVIECRESLKRRIYSRLSLDGFTMKEWFEIQAEQYILRRERSKT